METIMENESIIPILDEMGVEYSYNGVLIDVTSDTETIKKIMSELENMDYICDTDNPLAGLFAQQFATAGLKLGKENPVRLLVFQLALNEDADRGYITFEKIED